MHKMLRLRVYGCRNLGKIIWLSMGKIIAGLQGMCFSNFSMNALITNYNNYFSVSDKPKSPLLILRN